jgi:replicative DNA helicase
LKKHHNISTLPILTKDFTAKYEASIKQSKELVNLLDVDLGQQHVSLRTLTNKLLFQTPMTSWEKSVLPMIRGAAAEYNPPHPPERVEKLWQDCVRYVKSRKSEELQPKTLKQVSQERQVERKMERNAPSTGFLNLDKFIRGFIPGHLYLVSGDTNVGKTSISANFAVNVAEAGKKVLYLALEPDNTVIDYLNCCAFDITYSETADHDDYVSPNIDVYTKDQIKDLKQMIHLVKSLPRYDLVIIDHIGYFTSSGTGDTYSQQSSAIKQLVQLAKNKKMAVMVIAHLRKDVADVPGINDISGSGALKQDSTEVMIVIREKDELDEMKITYLDSGGIMVLKSKVGKNGYFPIMFKPDSAKIYDKDAPDNYQKMVQEILIK